MNVRKDAAKEHEEVDVKLHSLYVIDQASGSQGMYAFDRRKPTKSKVQSAETSEAD